MEDLTYKNISNFDELFIEIKEGQNGNAISIPTNMGRLDSYISIRPRIMQLVFSSTGAGKSAFVNTAFILNPYDWLYSAENITGLSMKTVLFSMERAKKYTIAKWISRKIFKEHQEIIDVPTMMGWKNIKLTKSQIDLIYSYKDYINKLEEDVDIYEGNRSPEDIGRILTEKAIEWGKYEQINEFKKIYTPNNPKQIVNIVIDHGNLTKATKTHNYNKKTAIDALVAKIQKFRDIEGFHIVWVAQVNRAMSGVTNSGKDFGAELTIDDVKQSGDIGDACDLGITLYDPLKYRQGSLTRYDPKDFIDPNTGAKKFRSITICKSSYGADDVRIPMAFAGHCGDMIPLPSINNITPEEYSKISEEVLNNQYFFK